MVRAVVLTCPRCDASYAVPERGASAAAANLRRLADEHLSTHDVRESRAALRKYAMAGRAEVHDVDADRVGEWVEADAVVA